MEVQHCNLVAHLLRTEHDWPVP